LAPWLDGGSGTIATVGNHLPHCRFPISPEEFLVKRSPILLLVAFFATTSLLFGQSASTPGSQQTPASKTAKAAKTNAEVHLKPFSRLALGGGVGVMGVNLQAATNVNRHLNLRGSGNLFNYTVKDITVSDFNLDAKVNYASAGVSLDYYPFPTHGLRLSPGVLFYNQNQITANSAGASGSSITLNDVDYYSENAHPLTVNAKLGLNTRQQAFTLTTGWGNMIPRKGGHWSFPFELGAAFTGVPTVNVDLSGYACATEADAMTTNGPSDSCVNMKTNIDAQSNKTAQVNKWKSDLDPWKVYPIFSFGASYAFHVR
jgi:hypothetical protein